MDAVLEEFQQIQQRILHLKEQVQTKLTEKETTIAQLKKYIESLVSSMAFNCLIHLF